MNSIVNDLRFALQRKALVNVYQLNQNVVYTGYVNIIDELGIVLTTFDDSGIEDGAVYLTFEAIEFVEFDSDDLDSMRFRIENAQQSHFVSYGKLTSAFNLKRPLIRQVLENAMVNESTIMVVERDSDKFYEGQVTRISDYDVDFQVFNKFELHDKPKLTFDFADILLVEFEGKELTLQTVAMGVFENMPPVTTHQVESQTGIQEALQHAFETNALVSLNPKADEGMFFVGRVNTLTNDMVLVNLVDMAGQFGGYWLTKLSAIQQVITRSDYLQVVETFISIDQRVGVTKQPGLNDERLFDPTTDLFSMILGQSVALRRIVRIQLHDDQSITGYLSRLDDKQFIFHQVEEGMIIDPLGTMFEIADVDEVAFDYMDAQLLEKELRNQGEL